MSAISPNYQELEINRILLTAPENDMEETRSQSSVVSAFLTIVRVYMENNLQILNYKVKFTKVNTADALVLYFLYTKNQKLNPDDEVDSFNNFKFQHFSAMFDKFNDKEKVNAMIDHNKSVAQHNNISYMSDFDIKALITPSFKSEWETEFGEGSMSDEEVEFFFGTDTPSVEF